MNLIISIRVQSSCTVMHWIIPKLASKVLNVNRWDNLVTLLEITGSCSKKVKSSDDKSSINIKVVSFRSSTGGCYPSCIFQSYWYSKSARTSRSGNKQGRQTETENNELAPRRNMPYINAVTAKLLHLARLQTAKRFFLYLHTRWCWCAWIKWMHWF